jgi:hypothetical protein
VSKTIDSITKSNVFVTKSIVSVTESKVFVIESNDSVIESNVSISESKPIEALQYGPARLREPFDAETCPAASGTSNSVLKCFIHAVLFIARLIGTELSKSNPAGSATETQGFAKDHFLEMTLLGRPGRTADQL